MITIYVLRDPLDGAPRYVGQTSNPAARLAAHLSETRAAIERGGSVSMKQEWIAGLLACSALPAFEIVEEVSQAHASRREHHWIRTLRASGARLCNSAGAPQHALRRAEVPSMAHGLRLPREVLARVDAEVARVNAAMPGAAATKTSIIIASIVAHCPEAL